MGITGENGGSAPHPRGGSVFSMTAGLKRPLIMGIVNITPDSFSDGGLFLDGDDAYEHCLKLVEDGADIIDIGGESTRPGAEPVSPSEQIGRVCPVIERLRAVSDIPVSIDTTSAEVVEKAIAAGAEIINDVSALRFDDRIAELAAEYDTGLILMHMKGTPETMQENPYYDDIIGEVYSFLEERAAFAEGCGVRSSNIVLDPGIGFGKTAAGNLELIRNIRTFKKLRKPVLIGASRKSFIGKLTGREVDDRLSGSLAVVCFSALNGVDILRVHDVEETVDALKLIEALSGTESDA